MNLRAFRLRSVVAAAAAMSAVAVYADDGWFQIDFGRGGVSVGFGNRNLGVRLDFADRGRNRRCDDNRFDRYGRYHDPRMDRLRRYERYDGYKRVDLFDRSYRIDSGTRPMGRGRYF